MISSKSARVAVLCALATLCATSAFAQIDARMLRQPSVSKDQIAFVYAGDIWLVPKKGGAAVRLTSSPGEESFPRFSPDGTKVIAYYDYIDRAVWFDPTTGHSTDLDWSISSTPTYQRVAP